MKLKEIDKKIEKLTEILEASTMINQRKEHNDLNEHDIKLNQMLIKHQRRISVISNNRRKRIFSFSISKLRLPNMGIKNTRQVIINKSQLSNMNVQNVSSSSNNLEEVKPRGNFKKASNNSNLAYFKKLQTRIEENYSKESLPEVKTNENNSKSNSIELESFVESSPSSHESPVSSINNTIITIKVDQQNNNDSFNIEPVQLNLPYINNEIREETEESNDSHVIRFHSET